MKDWASDRVKGMGGYAFDEVDQRVAALKKEGVKPIDFGVGDPTDDTPAVVRAACKKAVDKRKNSGYPSYVGCEEYRQTIAQWTKKRFGVSLDAGKEISSTVGAKEGVFNLHEGFVNPGDYVISPNPGYPPYERGTRFAEGKSWFYPLLQENDYLPRLSEIPSEVVKKAKILWINYPNNPTGAVATREFFKEAVDFGKDNQVIVASDECYTEIYFGEKPLSILQFAREGVISVQSLSKRSNMTCYRVGWMAGDESIVSVFKKVKTNVDSGTATFIQDAATAALKDEQHVAKMRALYHKKRDVLVSALKKAGMPDCTPPATLYLWQRAPQGMTGLDFALRLLQKDLGLVTTPGAWIARESNGLNPGKDFVRFALVPSLAECRQAAEKIRDALAKPKR
ncbi:MAG: aminotransferase class I/II-fold pyridoxal phosphate-dependent enzyme [Candidatus Diapherotrites archaeon]|uniref:Aminotransferase class I/II-fold pyridoxal phosphate-dependent enzyme n=1 Tax=Candidatus Iainarchaeum sp. TaxID=3101447 RepID=A0A8T4LCJ2_9ARCH|nr:aminotransferase class I/II-fold pyridoxal phosphate-dependent enzyme [Candidatus Diapherotrites archaeon]